MSALILVLAKATAVLLAAYVAATSMRKSAAGTRHLVWVAALGAVIALPLLARFAPMRLEVLPTRVIEQAAPRLSAPNVVTSLSNNATPARELSDPKPRSQGEGVSASQRSGTTVSPILIAWAVVSAALVGWLVVGALTVRRILRASRDLTTPDWTTPLCEVADRLDLAEVPRLVASDRIEMAFACNPFRPTIVLPATSENWTDDRRRAVLLHELAHVRRRDLFSHTVGRIACALYWFHPLVWTASKRLRAESERACDDLALTCGARPSEYAQHLLDMVTGVRRFGAPATALPMARKKEFEGRMLAILDPAIRRVAPGRMQSAMVVTSLAVLSLSIAAVAPARSAPVPPTTGAAPSVAQSMGPAPQVHTDVRQETRTVRTESKLTSIVQSSSTTPITKLPVQATPQSVAGDTGKVALFVRLLRTDSDAEIRKTAAWALSESRTETTLRALMDALKSDSNAEVREMSAWALAERGEAVIKPLADALRGDKNAEVRETAAWALGSLSARDELNTLVAAIGDANEEVRRTAIWAVGTIGTHTAPGGLVNALKDSDQEVRVVTAWALGEIADPATATALTNAFTSEKDGEVRSAELRALALMGKDTPALIESAITSTNTDLRRQAISMLAGKSGSWPWPWPWPRPRPSP